MDEASDDEYAVRDGFGLHGAIANSKDDPMLAAEGNARQLEHETAGIREGYEVGKEETVQEGFDQGFRLASSAGFAWGRAMGAAAVLDVGPGETGLTGLTGLTATEVKTKVCDALWEAHGEAKERFPERRSRGTEFSAREKLQALETAVTQRMRN